MCVSPTFNRSLAIWHFERSDTIKISDGILFNSYTRLSRLESVQTKVKVVAVHQELGEVEELWNKLFHICHVCFTGWPPCIWDTVEQSIRQVKMATLCVLWCVRKWVRGWEYVCGWLCVGGSMWVKSEWVSGWVDRCEGKMQAMNGICLLKVIP